MAKGNLLLGMTRGKVGDIVFTRGDGEQVIRARNRQPRNPRTPLQMVSRVILKTSSSAYSRLQAICNHSFEGRESATANQARFMQLNNAMLQERVADILTDGNADAILSSQATSFCSKSMMFAVNNPYIISEGSLQSVPYHFYNIEGSVWEPTLSLGSGVAAAADLTYAKFIELLGVNRGDQITIIQVSSDYGLVNGRCDAMKYVHVARVILEPGSGDLSVPLLGANNYINDPNPRNEGVLRWSLLEENTELRFDSRKFGVGDDNDKNLYAVAVILSRQAANGSWLRSSEQLLVSPSVPSQMVAYLGDAVASYMDAGLSSKYLNQAE